MIETIQVDAALGDRVWIDANGNGIQDSGNNLLVPGEVGLNGVKVKLLNLDGSLVAETVTTNGPADAPGFYTFEDIDFSLPQGPNIRVALPQYLIEFEAPDGFTFTKQDADPAQYLAGESPIDSDVDPTTGRLETGPLNPTGIPGAQIFTLDAGLIPEIVEIPDNKRGVVGDRIWHDLNKNGLQDEGEPGINGITIQLFDQAGAFVGESQTADNSDGEAGYYQFEGLNSGSQNFDELPFELGEQYTVEVELPEGYTFTVKDADPRLFFETDSGLDSDADRETGRFSTFPLTDLIGGISSVQLYWDAGLVKVDRMLIGSDRRDRLRGSRFADEIRGGNGRDVISGRRGDDVLSGEEGNDRLVGNKGSDLLLGGEGNDKLKGSTALSSEEQEFDVFQGGPGEDRFILGNAQGAFYTNGGEQDQALILDFTIDEDQMYLHGTIDEYRVETDSTSNKIFKGSELVATVNRNFFETAIDLSRDVQFVG